MVARARCSQASMASGRMMSTPNGRVRAARPPRMPACHQRAPTAGQDGAQRQRQEQRLAVRGREEEAGREDQQVPAGPGGGRIVEVQARQLDQLHGRHEQGDVGDHDRHGVQAGRVGEAGGLAHQAHDDGEQREERRARRIGRPIAVPGDVQVVERVPAAERLEDRIQAGCAATPGGWRWRWAAPRRRSRPRPRGSAGSPGTRRGRPAPWRDPAAR